jgi:hypothetical protein
VVTYIFPWKPSIKNNNNVFITFLSLFLYISIYDIHRALSYIKAIAAYLVTPSSECDVITSPSKNAKTLAHTIAPSVELHS